VNERARGRRLGAVVEVALLAAAFGATLAATTPADANADGKIAFRSFRNGGTQIFLMNPDGSSVTQLTTGTGDSPALSPDGTKIAFVRRDPSNDFNVWVMDVDGSNEVQLTTSTQDESYPVWSPDGTQIAYVRVREGSNITDIWVMNANGSNQHDLTNDPKASQFDPDWSSDGSRIAYTNSVRGSTDIWIMNADGTGRYDLTNDPSTQFAASWNNDDSAIAYRSDEAGTFDIWTIVLGTGVRTNLTTNDPGTDRQPTFSPDGTKIAYASDGSGNYDVYTMNADGSNQVDITPGSPKLDDMPDWGIDSGSGSSGVKVSVADSGFQPTTANAVFGTTVRWNFLASNTQSHTATDGTGMGLFDSGLRAPGSSYSFTFFAAASYTVVDTTTSHTGMVKTSMTATPPQGTQSTQFTITWASQPAPSGYLYDVQIKRPGAIGYTLWLKKVTYASATFTPDAGSGTYLFRARMRTASSTAMSGWSPSASIAVT
jgi:Tol biopolymer transport system component